MGPNPRILVVEDEPSFVEALEIGLRREGFEVVVVSDGAKALAAFEAHHPDVVLLDVMLPNLSGLDICREIRKTSRVPILMVTARSEEVDAVVGLEMGADDYITKPYRLRELVARIRAAMRRASESVSEPGEAEPADALRVGDIAIDLGAHEVTIRGEVVDLPLKEFELLATLASEVGRVVTRDRLIERVWGHDYVGDTKTLDVHIKRLRAKVETDPSNPERITTVRGVGYKLTAP